ncbi:MAG TPA: thioredoxin [Chthoniobacterales bacterium]
MASEHVVELTEANFDSEVKQSAVPVLVDFWAPWCGPCKMIGPVVEEIAAEKAGAFKVGKINVDDQPGLAQQFRINAIPALYVFKGGEVKDKVIGMTSKANLIAKLEGAA